MLTKLNTFDLGYCKYPHPAFNFIAIVIAIPHKIALLLDFLVIL